MPSDGQPNSLLNQSGSGPIFGEKTSLLCKSSPENLDLTPSFHDTTATVDTTTSDGTV